MEGSNATIFWMKNVLYAPGLTQNLFSMIAGNAQNLILNMNAQGEFVLVRQRNGNKLCDVSKTKSQYLLKAKALDGNSKKTYHAELCSQVQMRDLHIREADTFVFSPVHECHTEATRVSAC
jgi:hypothetical protein